MKRIGISIFAMAVFAGCSNSSSTKSSDESYSYEFSQNDCPTGNHSFKSKEALCSGLQDEALNKSCARTLRAQEFKAKACPGNFEPKLASAPQGWGTPKPGAPDLPSGPTPQPSVQLPGLPSGSTPPSSASVPSDSNTTGPAGNSGASSPVDPTADWMEKLVITSKEFSSKMDASCSDFLCLAWKLTGNTPVTQDQNDPLISVQKFSSLLARGVLLECTRKFNMALGNGISKATCQMTVDPWQASIKVSIVVSKNTSPQTVMVDIIDEKINQKLFEANQGQLMANNQDEVIVTDPVSKEKKVQRMQLSCTKGPAPMNCNISGVIQ